MAKYHVNPANGEPGLCRAKKQCRFGPMDEHYPSQEAARKAYEESQAKPRLRSKPPRTPILVEPTSLPSPLFWHLKDNQAILDGATDAEYADYYSLDYSEPTQLDLDKAIEIGLNLKRDQWPDDLKAVVEANRSEWSDVNKWSFELGFYEGDPMEFAPPHSLEPELTKWYYARPNATDYQGLLEHVREKGFDTSGLSPVEAVKKMLREENGKVLQRVENATHVRVTDLPFTNLSYAKTHYENIDPCEPVPASPRSKIFLGVVMAGQGHYRLLDGHHRFKWARKNSKNSGTFIVLQ